MARVGTGAQAPRPYSDGFAAPDAWMEQPPGALHATCGVSLRGTRTRPTPGFSNSHAADALWFSRPRASWVWVGVPRRVVEDELGNGNECVAAGPEGADERW